MQIRKVETSTDGVVYLSCGLKSSSDSQASNQSTKFKLNLARPDRIGPWQRHVRSLRPVWCGFAPRGGYGFGNREGLRRVQRIAWHSKMKRCWCECGPVAG